MRRTSIIAATMALAFFVSASQASAFGGRLPRRWSGWGSWHPSRQYSSRSVDQTTQPAPTSSASPVASKSLGNVVSGKVGISNSRKPGEYKDSDEQRCAEMGCDRCRMVYPRYSEVDPYPACKAWRWDDEDGWGWYWSELNCPWRQCPDRNDDYTSIRFSPVLLIVNLA